MAPAGRTPFSSEDDAHLVKYLAEFNELRKGNKIYQQLVDDRDKFPWAKRHSWQAWRHRYIRDTVDFDRRIHVQQKRNLRELIRNAHNEATPTSRNLPHPTYPTNTSPQRQKRKKTLSDESTVQDKRRRIETLEEAILSGAADFDAQNLARRIRLGEGPSRIDITKMNQYRVPGMLSVPQISSDYDEVSPYDISEDSDNVEEAASPGPGNVRGEDDLVERAPTDVKADDMEDENLAVGNIQSSHSVTSNSTDIPSNPGPVHQTFRKQSLPSLSSSTRERSSIPESTSWLSVTDQSRLVNSMSETLSERYNFPPEYVLRVWKETGNLEEAESILKELGALANGLLRDAISRRSSLKSAISSDAIGNHEEGPGQAAPPHATVHTRTQRNRSAGGDSSVVRKPSRLRQSFAGDSLHAQPIPTSPLLHSPENFNGRDFAMLTGSSSKDSIPTPPTSVSPAQEDAPITLRPGKPKSSASVDHLNADPESKSSNVEAVWPPTLQKVYFSISSPERKKVLQRFWKAHGKDFVQVESTLNENLQASLVQ
ncbi:hypothetical protein F5050DRAFT_1807883 [Lentinula boryana]|uniref:TERF2-interacting telomeric protein 1 Myb domain-containing protein n=1 Tax=Lentinula boryana TaxID=40481 RepID=A0ABQ8QCP4_9AGAR|nr:hypothetical protein F5050DRAFT_1807883 [Lentinula boryana]